MALKLQEIVPVESISFAGVNTLINIIQLAILVALLQWVRKH